MRGACLGCDNSSYAASVWSPVAAVHAHVHMHASKIPHVHTNMHASFLRSWVLSEHQNWHEKFDKQNTACLGNVGAAHPKRQTAQAG